VAKTPLQPFQEVALRLVVATATEAAAGSSHLGEAVVAAAAAIAAMVAVEEVNGTKMKSSCRRR